MPLNQIKFLVFGERGKPEYSGKSLFEKNWQPNKLSPHVSWRPGINRGYNEGRQLLLTLRQHRFLCVPHCSIYANIKLAQPALHMNDPNQY